METPKALSYPRLLEARKVEAQDPTSLDGRAELVRRAFRQDNPVDELEVGEWVEEVYDDRIVIASGEEFFRIDYTLDDGTVTFGDRSKVELTVAYEAASAAASAAGERLTNLRAVHHRARIREGHEGNILESLDEGVGRVWRVTMIRPGRSRNGRHYSREVLREAVGLYEGAQAFDGHRSHADRVSSTVRNLVGFHSKIGVGSEGELQSDFTISESAPNIQRLFLTAWKNDRPDLVGFSHDVSAAVTRSQSGSERTENVDKIAEVHSVDVVADPSAGGSIERLVASTTPTNRKDGTDMDPRLQALLDAAGELTDEQRDAIIAAWNADPANAVAPEGETGGSASSSDGAGDGENEGDGDGDGDGERELVGVGAAAVDAAVTEALNAPGSLLHGMAVERALASMHALPEETLTRITETLGSTPANEIDARVTETMEMWNGLVGARPQALPGQGAPVQGGEEAQDKIAHALDGMFSGHMVEGTRPFHSLIQAYREVTGNYGQMSGDEDYARTILAESVGCYASIEQARSARLTEALSSTSWAQALGDSVTRALIREYSFAPLQSWRQIVSDIVPINDFRTQRRARIGGYNTLPVVAENGAYTALTSPTDEEATYGITKKGGTEQLTMEIIANDDISALRRIPVNLGRSAALTLYRGVWEDLVVANPVTTYDAVAWFAAGHSNLTATTPLDEAGLTTLRTAMITQQRDGETSGFIGLTPKFVVVPPELWLTAAKLVDSPSAVTTAETATTANEFNASGRNPLTVVEVPTFADPNDWYLFCDPATCPTLEVGFFQGREEPELFVADQPTIGSVFTNDQILWKIRHIWGISILDHRGVQKATQA